MDYTIAHIRKALDLGDFDADSAQQLMMPQVRPRLRPVGLQGEPRLGGVLALLFYHENQLSVALTKRRDDLNSHAGQVSFPGGRNEHPESLLMTALRETEEEIGIASESLEVLGPLSPLYILPSDYEVHPFVAWYTNGSEPPFVANPQEVDRILEVPLKHLVDPETRSQEPWEFRGQQISIPFYAVDGYKVWGATAMMLSELVERLRMATMRD